MGDYYTNVIPIDVEPEDAKAVAEKLLAYLLDRQIIQPGITDCTLTKTGGHAPGINYAQALTEPSPLLLTLHTNGVEIIVERSAFDSGGLEEIQCPQCAQSLMDTNWGAALQAWLGRRASDSIHCPSCSFNAPVTAFIFEPPFVFAELGLTFWNWGDNLSPAFIEELEQVTDSRIAITVGKY